MALRASLLCIYIT